MKLSKLIIYFFVVLNVLFVFSFAHAQTKNVLLFVSYEDTYYSEYVVMFRALRAAGYNVDVRSASTDSASTYMIPANTDIAATAATLPGSSYAQFLQQFQQSFDSSWNASWNATPAFIPVNGRIQDIVNMNNYEALVLAGGTGVQAYRLDGSYNAQGAGARMLSAATVQNVAVKLNALAIECLLSGKPVMGQCHGASLPVFWRVPGTIGTGMDSLGFSILRNNAATGFPEPQTLTTWNSLSVVLRPDDRVTISSPHSSLNHQGNAIGKIMTTRDWYPQTVAYAARALLNVLQTFPSKQQLQSPKSVLILHGGAVDSLNCSPANRINDIPCNHGTGTNLPADFRHLQLALMRDSPNDSFTFSVTSLNISGTGLPFNANNAPSILSYLQGFNTVIFFKHWSTDVTIALQNALAQYADGGGGLLSLHHGMYNDSINSLFHKNILRDQVFGLQSSSNTWSGVSLMNYDLFHTNYGHFISTYGISNFPASTNAPASWNTQLLLNSTNFSFSNYHRFTIFEELYNNMQWMPAQNYGRGINQNTPLFSNGQSPSAINHTSGFVKLYNPSLDASIGKVAYLQPGERRENYDSTTIYFQVIRNTVAWLSNRHSNTTVPVHLLSAHVSCVPLSQLKWITLNENHVSHFEVQTSNDGIKWEVLQVVSATNTHKMTTYQFDLTKFTGWKLLKLIEVDMDGKEYVLKQFANNCNQGLDEDFYLHLFPNPTASQIKFKLEESTIEEISVTDRVGKSILLNKDNLNKNGSYYTVDMSFLSKGIYVFQARTNDKVYSAKFIKE